MSSGKDDDSQSSIEIPSPCLPRDPVPWLDDSKSQKEFDDWDALEKKENTETIKANRELRKKYANRAYWFAVGSVLFWMALLVWTGCASYYKARPLFAESVLIAVTTATTINLFAAFLGVIRGLFPTKP